MDGIISLHLGHDVDHRTNGEAWLIEHLAPDAATFVDIGANAGDWTALFLERTREAPRGLLVDASSSAHARLTRRFQDYAGVQVLHVAASDASGEVTFYEEEDAGMTSSLVSGFSNASARPVTVRSVTVDALLQEHDMMPLDYLKIDAEGFDLHVLRGARASLRSKAIRFLQFEYNDAWLRAGSTLGAALGLLHECGYVTFLLKGNALHEFPYAVYGEHYHYSNFAAFPTERFEELKGLVRGRI
jgi:FkbM family methyltransferase